MKKNMVPVLGMLFHFCSEVIGMNANANDSITGLLVTRSFAVTPAYNDIIVVAWSNLTFSVGTLDFAQENGIRSLERGNSLAILVKNGGVFLPRTDAQYNFVSQNLDQYSRVLEDGGFVTFTAYTDEAEVFDIDDIAYRLASLGRNVVMEKDNKVPGVLAKLGISQ
jgi:hypothetical protein